MDIVLGVIWWIILNNPVNIWEVETTLSNVSTQQYAICGLIEFEICRGTLLLFLFAVNIFDLNVDVI